MKYKQYYPRNHQPSIQKWLKSSANVGTKFWIRLAQFLSEPEMFQTVTKTSRKICNCKTERAIYKTIRVQWLQLNISALVSCIVPSFEFSLRQYSDDVMFDCGPLCQVCIDCAQKQMSDAFQRSKFMALATFIVLSEFKLDSIALVLEYLI
jgi:hypothetical protein